MRPDTPSDIFPEHGQMIAAAKARWKRGTFTFPCHANDATMECPCWRWKNVIIFKRQWRSSGSWSLLHAPTKLGLAASWSRLRDAKAAVEAMDAEFGLDLLDYYESWDSKTHSTIVSAVRRHREYA
jgi:hypothetical protein